MNIHFLWLVCILIRILIILFIRNKYKKYRNIITFILSLMGLGFLFKSIFGSNNEIQIKKVFWHETRLIHSYFYLLSAIYLFKNNINMNTVILLTDLIFSIIYRLVINI